MPLLYQTKIYYSPAEFADKYSVKVQTIYNWIKAGMTKDGASIEVIKLLDKTFVRIK